MKPNNLREEINEILNELYLIDNFGNCVPADGINLFTDKFEELISQREQFLLDEVLKCLPRELTEEELSIFNEGSYLQGKIHGWNEYSNEVKANINKLKESNG